MFDTRFGLVALGFAAALGAQLFGCNGSVATATGGNGGTGGISSTCPAAPPPVGTSCDDPRTCQYGPAECPTTYTCDNAKWTATVPPCAPPTCPAAQPANGDSCIGEGLTCQYSPDPGCGEVIAEATCKLGTWQVLISGPACIGSCPTATPPLGGACSSCCVVNQGCEYFDTNGCVTEITCTGVWTAGPSQCPATSPCAQKNQQSTCVTDPACRWLVEAPCGDTIGVPPPFPQGCYPKPDCVDNVDCTGGGTCLQMKVDPCPAGDCSECVTTARICVP